MARAIWTGSLSFGLVNIPVEPWEDLVKGYEYSKGRFVVLTKEDFRTAAVEKTRRVDLMDFVSLEGKRPAAAAGEKAADAQRAVRRTARKGKRPSAA